MDTNRQAKNVIIFLGDGMGVSTLTAARIAKGQQAGLEGGEQAVLSFEEFPHLALSRTYCVDSTGNDYSTGLTTLHLSLSGGLGVLGDGVPGRGEGDLQDHWTDWGRPVQGVRHSAGH